jgi:hypothetical protein
MGRKGQEQRDAKGRDAQRDREDHRGAHGRPIRGAAHQGLEIVEPDPLCRPAKGIAELKAWMRARKAGMKKKNKRTVSCGASSM